MQFGGWLPPLGEFRRGDGRAAAAAATDDYRKLALGELRALIREKLGSPGINIEAAGPNHYTVRGRHPTGRSCCNSM